MGNGDRAKSREALRFAAGPANATQRRRAAIAAQPAELGPAYRPPIDGCRNSRIRLAAIGLRSVYVRGNAAAAPLRRRSRRPVAVPEWGTSRTSAATLLRTLYLIIALGQAESQAGAGDGTPTLRHPRIKILKLRGLGRLTDGSRLLRSEPSRRRAAHWERRLSSRLVAVAARCRVGGVWAGRRARVGPAIQRRSWVICWLQRRRSRAGGIEPPALPVRTDSPPRPILWGYLRRRPVSRQAVSTASAGTAPPTTIGAWLRYEAGAADWQCLPPHRR